MVASLGDYDLLEEIGRGGMGVVYRAWQKSLRREVALKVLPPELAHQPWVARRFAAEARKMAQLSHPNITPVYQVGEETGHQFFAMHYLRGGALSQRLQSGPLSVPQALWIAVQILEALDYAHRRGVIHRDVKPANILFDEQGTPVLTDFGIAKAADDQQLTTIGTSVGTPRYMSPEQAASKQVDHRADIYAMGIVLYEMVCGRPPFDGPSSVAIAVRHINEPPVPPRALRPDLPLWLESVILKALAKDPGERFASAGEMAEALRQQMAMSSTSRSAWRYGGHGRPLHSDSGLIYNPGTRRPPSRPPVLIAALAVVIAAIVALGTLALTQATRMPSTVAELGGAGTGKPSLPSASPPPPPPPPPAPKLFTVPDVVGKPATEAEYELEAAGGFKLIYNEPRHSEKYSAGIIISQFPAPGTPQEAGDVVYLAKSLGPRPRPSPGAGLVLYDGPYGFRILQPAGWKPRYEKVSYGHRLTFASGDQDYLVKVEWSVGGPDAEATIRHLDWRFRSRHGTKYEPLGIAPATPGAHSGWRWDFILHRQDGRDLRKIDFMTDYGDVHYAVLCQAPVTEFADWFDVFESILASFKIGP